MNDPSELSHGIDFTHLVADELALEADNRVRSFLRIFKDMFRHANFQATLEFFIASFSRCRDDLGQWRAYADKGRGFAIGFSPCMFPVTEKPPADKPAEFVGAVCYRGREILDRFRAPIQQAGEIFLAAMDANADVFQDEAIRLAFMRELARELIASPMIWRCLTIKHSAYEHESEVRLVITGTPERLRPYITTRFRGSEIVPYIRQPMPLREQNNIVEIMVGPSAPPDTERTLRTMLNSLGVGPEVFIHRSNIPY
jgi:hypothetical protein